MHILLLSYYYPPAPEVGAVRPSRLAERFRAAGHTVTVITAALPGEAVGVRFEDEWLSVVAVESPPSFRELLFRAKVRALRPAQQVSGSGRQRPPAVGREDWRARMKRWVYSILWTPDDRTRFISRAVQAARRVHRERPIDVIYSTAPPFSVHLSARLAATFIKRPCVAEFRDPWTDVHRHPSTRSVLSDRVESAMERKLLRDAAAIVAVTPQIGSWLGIKRLRLGRTDEVLVAFNGVPAFPEVQDGPGQGSIEVLHAGSLYLNRDPRPFFEAVAQGVRSGVFGPRGIRVTMLGAHGGSYGGVPVSAMAEEFGIGGLVAVEPQLPWDQCQERMCRATALLLLAQGQPAQIPNKLFDYLAARRPIIALADPEGESATLLRRVGGHHTVDPALPDVAERLVAAVKACAEMPPGPMTVSPELNSLTTEAELDRVVRLVEGIGGSGATEGC